MRLLSGALMVRSSLLICVGLVWLAMVLVPALALAETARYGVLVKGIRIGTFHLTAQESGGTYAVRAVFDPSNLMKSLRRVGFEGQAKGRLAARGLAATQYDGRQSNGKLDAAASIRWAKGIPTVTLTGDASGPLPHDADPAGQRGSVDPVSAMFATLRDLPKGKSCTLALATFDGRRAGTLRIDGPKGPEASPTCTGEFRRIAGYPPEVMAERSRFAFTLTYARLPDGGLRVVGADMQSAFGPARLVRE